MAFVKVRHQDGRSADITEAEVPFYRSLGFDPVDGQALAGVPAKQDAAPVDPLVDEIRGLRRDLSAIFSPADVAGELAVFEPDPRIDQIIDELKAIRAAVAPAAAEPAASEQIELREPAAPLNLEAMSREQLNAHAATVGIEDPAAFANKPALIEAIRAATSPNT